MTKTLLILIGTAFLGILSRLLTTILIISALVLLVVFYTVLLIPFFISDLLGLGSQVEKEKARKEMIESLNKLIMSEHVKMIKSQPNYEAN